MAGSKFDENNPDGPSVTARHMTKTLVQKQNKRSFHRFFLENFDFNPLIVSIHWTGLTDLSIGTMTNEIAKQKVTKHLPPGWPTLLDWTPDECRMTLRRIGKAVFLGKLIELLIKL